MASPFVANAYTLQRRVTLDVPSIAAGSVQVESFTVTGLKQGQVVVVNKHTRDTGLDFFQPYVSADDTLAIPFFNPTASAINPSSQTFEVVAL